MAGWSIRVACAANEEALLRTVLDRLRDPRLASSARRPSTRSGSESPPSRSPRRRSRTRASVGSRLRGTRGRHIGGRDGSRRPALGARLPPRVRRVAGEGPGAPGGGAPAPPTTRDRGASALRQRTEVRGRRRSLNAAGDSGHRAANRAASAASRASEPDAGPEPDAVPDPDAGSVFRPGDGFCFPERSQCLRKPALKASPAPIVSTTSTATGSTAPRRPRPGRSAPQVDQNRFGTATGSIGTSPPSATNTVDPRAPAVSSTTRGPRSSNRRAAASGLARREPRQVLDTQLQHVGLQPARPSSRAR